MFDQNRRPSSKADGDFLKRGEEFGEQNKEISAFHDLWHGAIGADPDL
jgi:hypothetical protein